MKRSEWQVIFCEICTEPTPPDNLVKISGHRVCKDCSLDRFQQQETFGYHHP